MQRGQCHPAFRSCQFSYPLPFRGQVCETQSSLPCCPPAVLSSRRPPSLDRVPVSPVPRRHQYYEGATTSHSRIPGHLFASLPGPTRFLHGSCSPLPALPGEWRPRLGPGSLFDRRSPLPVRSRVDASGISQVPRRSILCLCSGLRPRPNRRSLANGGLASAAPAAARAKASACYRFRGYREASAPAVYASRAALPQPMQDSLPAGWLASTGRESNPLDRDKRFPSGYISSSSPGFSLTQRCSNSVSNQRGSLRRQRVASMPARDPISPRGTFVTWCGSRASLSKEAASASLSSLVKRCCPRAPVPNARRSQD